MSDVETKKTAKKTIKEASRKKSIEDILSDTFSVKTDKDGNVKPANITKTDLKALFSGEKKENFGAEIIDTVCNDIGLTDPCMDCLAEIVLHVMDSKGSDCQKGLFDICIRIASGAWINKHRGSMDLYEDIFEGSNDRGDAIKYMGACLNSMFEKRIASLAKMGAAKPIDTAGSGSENSKSMEANTRSSNLTKKSLEKQKRNLWVIGVLWLLDRGKVDLETAVEYLFNLIDTDSTSRATFRDTSIYLAGQCLAPDARFLKTVSILRNKVNTLEGGKSHAEELLRQREKQVSQLQRDLSAQKQEIENVRTVASEYQASNEGLKKQLEDQQLDERATRTHLRDSEGKVRAKAFNLLSEEVLEPLRLSLAALQRENPKTENAAHQIELVLESIERDLQWFKE